MHKAVRLLRTSQQHPTPTSSFCICPTSMALVWRRIPFAFVNSTAAEMSRFLKSARLRSSS